MAAKIKVKPVKNHGGVRYLVDMRAVGKGRKFFATKTAAVGFAEALQKDLDAHGSAGLRLSMEETAEILDVKRQLPPGVTWRDLLRSFLAYHPTQDAISLMKGGQVFEMEKRQAGNRELYLRKMRVVVKSMDAFAPNKMVHEWTREMVEGWVGKKVAMSTKKYAVQDANSFFAFARRKKWIKINPCEDIEAIKVDEFSKGILTPAQMKVFFATVRAKEPRLVRYFADQAYGGLREGEARLVAVADFSPDYLHLSKTKVRRERFIDLNSLWRWWITGQGAAEVWPAQPVDQDFFPIVNWNKRVKAIKKWIKADLVKAGLVTADFWFPKNCLRHSFCSYGAVMFGAEKTARWSGHSEQTQRRHYRRPVPEAEAREYWILEPNH